MSIRFRNPWVDPRVQSVRPADVVTYLRAHGWREQDATIPATRLFRSPPRDEDWEAVLVPEKLDEEVLLNLLVECVGKVAGWESRYAGDLLNELLGEPAAANGTTHGQPTRTTA